MLIENNIRDEIWECGICGYLYDKSKGSARDGIKPGTPFSELPEDWVCPDCQVGQEFFEPHNN
ncbi:rubredoxin [Teredinibacter franksiae]|uniref:rubredoxin n=1 Tax=Teredinibacter franksiae TaxID=2761453 RepID=UPI001623FFAD|nr:rubredoxin [Teredinibacter franksiae]